MKSEKINVKKRMGCSRIFKPHYRNILGVFESTFNELQFFNSLRTFSDYLISLTWALNVTYKIDSRTFEILFHVFLFAWNLLYEWAQKCSRNRLYLVAICESVCVESRSQFSRLFWNILKFNKLKKFMFYNF
jgi:hypothetical protein